MGLFSYFSKLKDGAALARLFRAGLSPFDIFRQQIKKRKTDPESLMKRYKDWVYICASKNATSVADVPLRLYVTTGQGQRSPKDWVLRKGLKKKQADYIYKQNSLLPYTRKAVNIEEVLDHPFLNLWTDVNPYAAGFSFRELLILDLEITGDSFIYIYKDEVLGIPKELWRLPPQWTTIVPSPKDFIKGYLYGKERNKRIAFKPEEVVHFLYPNPRDLYRGMSPLEGALSAVDIDNAMSKYDLTTLDNNGRPDFIVSYKGKLTKGKAEKLEKDWRRLYGGRQKVGKPAFLDQDADIKTLGWSPKEMAFLAGQKWTMKKISNAYGVPQSMIESDDVNRANADAGNYQYQKWTVKPRLKRIEEILNQHIIPMYDERLFVAYDNPVPEDEEFRLKEKESNLKTGYSSINQERQIDNLEPNPWGNLPIMPLNVAPLGTAQSMANSQQPKGRSMIGYKRQDVPIDRPLPVDTLPPMDADERKFERLIRRILSEQEKDVIGALEKNKGIRNYGDGAEITFINDKGIDDAVLNRDIWDVKVAKMTAPQIIDKVSLSGNSALRQVGIEIPEWIERPETAEWIKDHTFQFARQINRTTENILKNTLTTSVQSGASISTLKKRIQEAFNLRRKEAERIARTEMNRAQNGGTVEAWKQSGVVTAQIWDAANDSCPFCYQMHGKTVALDGVFIPEGDNAIGYVDDAQVIMPMNYGDVRHPPLHPNCRCTLIPKVKEID